MAVVEDQLSLADADALAGPARRVLGVEPERPEPADAHHAVPHRHVSHVGRHAAGEHDSADGPARIDRGDRAEHRPTGAPSTRDWAEADHGATAIDPDARPPGRGAGRTAVALVVGSIGVPVAVVVGVASGGVLLAIVAGAAVAALAWSFWISGRR